MAASATSLSISGNTDLELLSTTFDCGTHFKSHELGRTRRGGVCEGSSRLALRWKPNRFTANRKLRVGATYKFDLMILIAIRLMRNLLGLGFPIASMSGLRGETFRMVWYGKIWEFAVSSSVLLISSSTLLLGVYNAIDGSRGGGGGGDFVAGFLLGGAVFGTLAYIFAPQIRRSILNEDEYGFRRAKRPIYYDEGLEKTRQTLNEKIGQLNSAIDNVSSRLRGGNNVPIKPAEIDSEIEATMRCMAEERQIVPMMNLTSATGRIKLNITGAKNNFLSIHALDAILVIVLFTATSLRCTESFMRENVVQELKHMKPDDETKKKMLNILKRFHSEEEEMDPMDEDDGGRSVSTCLGIRYCSLIQLHDPSVMIVVKFSYHPSFLLFAEQSLTIKNMFMLADSVLSEETIQKILSGHDLSLDDLSSEEMKCFRRAMASGELSKLIEPWEPWWLKPSARTIILSRCYCFTLRLYNGDWYSDALGAALVLFSISSVLGEGGQPQTVSEALAHCLEQTCSPAYKDAGGLQLGLGLVDDTMCLLNLGEPAIICLLCDLQRLFEAAGREKKQEQGRKMKSEVENKLKLADRKVYFLMCWVHEQPPEVWSSLASFVEIEKKSMTTLKDHGGDAKLLRINGGNPKGKVLIEEV
ncbi:hypothetical protein Sjap_004407 [Stephania japonica]|uniref:Uncharacterized protein n=1 Tax=Stephania japonica TaxID=461633 RepID=A0AAP0PJ20_9MAGN